MMTGNFLGKLGQLQSKRCKQVEHVNSQLVPLPHKREVRYQQPWLKYRGRYLSAQHRPLPTFTALLLIAPVDTVQVLIADPAELDASAVLAALELCRTHCVGGKCVGIRHARQGIRCEVRAQSAPVGSATSSPPHKDLAACA